MTWRRGIALSFEQDGAWLAGGGGGRRRWLWWNVVCVDEDGGGVAGDGEGLTGSESAERVAGEAEGAAVVGVRGGEVVARVDSLLHETAPVLAPPHRVLVFQLGRRATHLTNNGGA